MSQDHKINSSPDRHTFQEKKYLERCEESDRPPSEEYLNLFESIRQQDHERLTDPKWQQNNLEYNLRSNAWICDKVKASDTYAQNLYAAMCNQDWQRNEVWPRLKNQTWSCSWRSAGGIIADMREEGDYIDWYCSGCGLGADGDEDEAKGYVPEGQVTEEIQQDLFRLGWIPVDNHDE